MDSLNKQIMQLHNDLLLGKQKSLAGYKDKNGKLVTFLTPKQLAEYLQVSERTLDRWRKRNEGPEYIKNISKRIRYPLAKLELWLQNNLAPTTPEK